MSWRRASFIGLVIAGLSVAGDARETPADAFGFFRPIVHIGADDMRRLAGGGTVVRVLPSDDGELAAFAAIRTTADGPRLVEWIRNVPELKKSEFIAAIARFSNPPRLDDLRALSLGDEDIAAIRECRPGRCDVKLTAAEIDLLRHLADRADAEGRSVFQDAFRQLMLARVRRYLHAGQRGLDPYADRDAPVSIESAFADLLRHSPFLTDRVPQLSGFLAEFPDARGADIESFAYWSTERLGGRPTVTATHVAIVEPEERDLPEAIVAGKQMFATHYTTASLSITAIVRGRSPSERYLTYVNRSRVDVLDRWYGGLARRLIERRIKADAALVLRGLRQRLESGSPPIR